MGIGYGKIKPSGCSNADAVEALYNLQYLVSVLCSGTIEGAANSGLTSAAKSTITASSTYITTPTITKTDI